MDNTRLVTLKKGRQIKTVQSFPGWETYDLQVGAQYSFDLSEKTPWTVVENASVQDSTVEAPANA